MSRFDNDIDLADRGSWKTVPSDLFALETEPLKASSDPGYYGREYSFKGDAVIENGSLTAVFWAAKGRLLLYSKAKGSASGFKVAEIVPLEAKPDSRIQHYSLIRNVGDEVVLETELSGLGRSEVTALFSFGKGEIVEVKPSEKIKGISVISPVQYGVVPSFVGDDLIFGASEEESATALSVPSEHLFLGLLKGEGHELVMTWPKGKQQMHLKLGSAQEGKRPIESVELENDGQSIYLATLAMPGIWHREGLSSSFLERDVELQWKRPFPARWQTQLWEGNVRTTYKFRDAKGTVWRGVPGSYNYPVWFDGDGAYYHLSKKVLPKGESIVYFLEGQDTPACVSAPADILKETLGRAMSEPILDVVGRRARTHHRRGGDGVRRACTCGCTEAIQAVFEAHQEVEQKEYIDEAIGDMIYFVQHHIDRIDEYRRFAGETIKFLKGKESSAPELKEYLDGLEQIAQQIPDEYNVQLENMKSLDYAGELARKTMALTDKDDPTHVGAYMDLLKAWRGMGGAQDYVVAQCHMIARKLFQEAGYATTTQPHALEVAQDVRNRCRQVLRNPDGYEIWPSY
jgi:hypothetical protein